MSALPLCDSHISPTAQRSIRITDWGALGKRDLRPLEEFPSVEELRVEDYMLQLERDDTVKKLQYLRILILRGVVLLPNAAKAVLAAVQSLPRIERVDLDNCGIETSAFAQLLSLGSQSIVLQSLSFRHNEVLMAGIRWPEAPVSLTLRRLCVTIQCYGSSGAQSLRRLLTSLPQLSVLSLESSDLDTAAGEVLASALPNSLRKLSLKAVGLPQKTWADVLNALKCVRFLQSLDCSDTSISDFESLFLGASVQYLPHLHTANLSSTVLAATGQLFLTISCPSVKWQW